MDQEIAPNEASSSCVASEFASSCSLMFEISDGCHFYDHSKLAQISFHGNDSLVIVCKLVEKLMYYKV